MVVSGTQWTPPNLSQLCAVHTYVTNCGPSTFLFLKLIATLFGRSRDVKTNKIESDRGGFAPDMHDINPDLFWQSHGKGAFQDYDRGDGHSADNEDFDFIIVGAGSAGCVLANRLSEISKWKILLLEAGSEEPDVADVPAFAPMLQRSSIDWNYMTQPERKSCRARMNGQCAWARGRVMGGSSTLNYMIYIRGGPLDYDEWATSGNPGWRYKDVLPYFIKSEDNRNIKDTEPYYHGTGGYQTVERMRYQDQNTLAVLQAFEELGLENIDLNSEQQIGVTLLQTTTRDGERLSANGAFIRPIRSKRQNLTIRTNTEVVRIIIDEHSKKAIGVEYIAHGKSTIVSARKEVILSAGSINSPKVLMLSGIGSAVDLEPMGIKVIKDLAVGYNLQDHASLDGILLALPNKTSTILDDYQRQQEVQNYRETHDGPLASTGPLQINAMVQTQYASSVRPDIQYSIDAANTNDFISDPILTASTNVQPLPFYSGLVIRPILLNPKSRGVVRLNNTDPVFGTPLIYPGTFTERIDLLTMIEGIKQGLNLVNTKALQKIGARLVTEPLPACKSYKFGTDQYWECLAMSYTTTIYHPVGTCKMGPKNDRDAVVDAQLRVYGIKNLRVVDASIIPIITRGNTNAPTIMIAEKASDHIKSDWDADKFGSYDQSDNSNLHQFFN